MQTQNENPDGLHQRYVVKKIVGWRKSALGIKTVPLTKPVSKDAEYFVMRLDTGGSDIEHIKACRKGIHAYAKAIEKTIPQLAKDLKERYPLL